MPGFRLGTRGGDEDDDCFSGIPEVFIYSAPPDVAEAGFDGSAGGAAAEDDSTDLSLSL